MKTLTKIVCVTGLVLAACSTTSIVSTWKRPDVSKIAFNRVVVIAATRDPATRRAVEDQLVGRLKGRAVSSYTLTPQGPVDDELHALILQRQFDGAIVMRVSAIEREADWVPGTWSGPYYGYGAMDYWGDPGHYETNTNVRVETNVYELPGEQLIWAASSKTVNPKNVKELIDETVDVVAKELKKQGLVDPDRVSTR